LQGKGNIQLKEEEEEPLQGKGDIQLKEDKEEPLQGKGNIQLKEDEEEPLQGKGNIQLKEDEEEPLQGKGNIQLKEDEEEPLQGKGNIQLKEEEEEPLQGKGDIQLKEDKEEPLQGKGNIQLKEDEEEPLQGKGNIQLAAKEKKESSNSTGMPDAVKSKMEGAFNTDFSDVKIHTNSEQSKQLGALAFTQGSNVHFASNQYNPNTQGGQELLGHELTHVVQQRQGRVQPTKQGKGMSINDSPALENEADVMGKQAAQGKSVEVTGKGSGIQKAEKQEIVRGELTSLGEGSNAQTKYIHWPGTESSGVTLGKGYDIGSRTKEKVIEELVVAGMSQAQAAKIAEGAKLKGADAQKFVNDKKNDIGEIPPVVQMNLLSDMLKKYTNDAKVRATSEEGTSGKLINARDREVKEDVPKGTYVMSAAEWNNLHPAMIEFLTDLIYQGGYYGYDRVAKINEALKENNGDHLKQFKAVKELFTTGYMDEYAGSIGEHKISTNASETFYGQQIDLKDKFRRNQIRLAYLNQVISALESSKIVEVVDKKVEVSSTTTANNPANTQVSTDVPELSVPATFTSTYTVKKGEGLYILAAKYGITIDQLKMANADKLKTWGNIQGFNESEIIRVPAIVKKKEQKDIGTHKTPGENISSLYKSYSGGAIGMPDFARGLLPYVKTNANDIIAIFDKLAWSARDNFAYALAANSNDSSLSTFDKHLLNHMSDALDSFLTLSRDENLKQKERIDKYLGTNKAQAGAKLSGTNYEALKKSLDSSGILTAEQIKNVRQSIASLTDEAQKHELYLELQKKTPYHNQRNNESKATQSDAAGNSSWLKEGDPVGDIMCNLTSLAMDLEYLGVSNPDPKMQFEDYLEKLRKDKGLGGRTDAETWKKLAKEFNINSKTISLWTSEKNILKAKLLPELAAGGAISLSAFGNNKGHIVRLEEINDNGMVVDDPYGTVLDFAGRESGQKSGYKTSTKDNRNDKNKEESLGNDNIWTWENISKISIKYAVVFYP